MLNGSTIDFHAHILHPELASMAEDKMTFTGFGARIPPRPAGSPLQKSYELMLEPDLHVAEMDRRGIGLHVLSSPTVVQGTFWASQDEEPKLCAMMNDTMASWVVEHPSRFVGSMVLPFQNMPESLAEIDRCCKQFAFRIVNAPSNVRGKYMGEECFNDYWRVAAERNLITFIHPEGVRDPWFQNHSLWNSIGQPIEETKVMASLIYEGVLDRYHDLVIVMAHGGGYLPLYTGRLDRNVKMWPDSTRNIRRLPSDYIRQFYYDTCLYDPAALARLIECVGSDRILFGSDFPFGDPSLSHQLDRINDLSADDRMRISGGNATALLTERSAPVAKVAAFT